MRILESIIDWILPRKCISCGMEVAKEHVLCPACLKDAVFVDFPYCMCCGKLIHSLYSDELACSVCQNTDRYFDLCRSLFLYNKVSKRIVMRIKRDADESVAKACVELLCEKYSGAFGSADVIVPVPLHVTRLLKRGFNQTDIIAKHISKITGVAVNSNILRRKKRTESQHGKNIEERMENVSCAFEVISEISGIRILIVDDVITTGATLSECARILKEHGASCVYCATIAST
jgi:ComF family protein